MKSNILNSIENYKTDIEQNECVLFLKYVGLIHELIESCNENIFIKKEDYLKHVIIKAIKNILYIYTFILLYTKNLDLTIYHTQKSILYYIEFIAQIGEENHNFLKLNSKDASLFIYKKTIFDINNDFRKQFDESEENKSTLEKTHKFIDIYNDILIQFIKHNNFKENDLKEVQKIVFTKVYKIAEAIIQLAICKESLDEKLDVLRKLVNEINKNYHLDFIEKNYLYLIESLVKKVVKNNIDFNNVKNRLNSCIGNEKLKTYSVCKIVNYLIS